MKLIPITAYLLVLLITSNSCKLIKPAQSKYQEKEKIEEEDGMRQAWSQEKERTIDPHSGKVPVERLNDALSYARTIRTQQSKKTRNAVSNITWEERGPNNVGGRTRCVIYDKNDTTYKTVWAGSVGGGLWKTTDITSTNTTWTHVNDFFDNLAISTIAQDPSNYNVIYFGTGEGYFNGDAIQGLGIWKTTDGGTTWNQLPSTNNSNFFFVQKIIVQPNGDVFASTNSGIYKSFNNGISWTLVLANGVSGASHNYGYDMEFGANGDIYATVKGEIFKSSFATYLSNTGNVGTWTNISPSGIYDRVELCTAPSDSNVVYSICANLDSVLQIMRSPDAGNSWSAVTKPGFCDQGFYTSDYTRGQAWYNLIGAVDPNDANTIYIGGVDALKSTNGGLSWTQISSWSGGGAFDCVAPGNFVHADHHAIVFKGNSSNEILWGTDGGVYRTTDSASTFESKINDYNVTQYYGCAIHPLLTNYFLAGAQDNGTHQFTSTGINSTYEATGGDGMLCHIDQTDGQIQITSYYNNYYNVSTDNGNTFNFIGGDGSGRFVNPTDFDDSNKILYGAYTYGNYELVTGVGTSNTFEQRNIYSVVDSSRATCVTVDPNNSSTVWMGFRSYSFTMPRVVRIENASSLTPTATIMSTGLPTDSLLYISNLDIEKGNSNHMLLCYSNYGANSVYESNDGALTWHSVEGNLPDMPVRWVMLHPDSNDMAFVATDLGVWSTNDLNGANTNWTQTNNNLANVSVHMLQYRPSDHTLAAATHGRGLFTAVLPHTPSLNFDAITKNEVEITSVNDGCRKYKDYIVNAMTSLSASPSIKANVMVQSGASANELLDFEYTTNGSFSLPSHKIEFIGSTVSIPVIIRVYDDKTFEPTPESFTLTFDSISSNAIAGIHNQLTFTITDNDDNPLYARKPIWVEDFESGVNPPADWNLVGIDVNQWGNNNFACASTINNFTMQVYNTVSNSCGYDNTASSDAVVYRKVNANAFQKLQADFDWIGEGESGYDWGELVYSTDTLSPVWTIVPGTPVFNGTSTVVHSAYDLPGTLDNTTFLIGWHWLNDYAVGGTAFGIDNIAVSGLSNRNIETNLSDNNEYLGPFGESYYYNTDGDLICKIENLSNHDFGCTKVDIDRAGNGAQFLSGEIDTLKKVFDKTYLVHPANANTSANIKVTFYVSDAEKNGYETQGRSWGNDAKIFKTADSISLAGINTPKDTAISLVKATYLDGYFVSGEFNSGFSVTSGFGIGNPRVFPLYTQSFLYNGMTLYPNPVSDYCTIETKHEIAFQLINSVGQIIQSFAVNGKMQLNMSRLDKGIYFVKAIHENAIFKVIKN